MAVIKNAKSDRMLKEAIVLDLGDLGRQADRILASARAEAARIMQQAQAEARQLIESADERGFAQGHERGLLEGRAAGEQEGRAQAMRAASQQLQQLNAAWTEAIERWEAQRREMFHDAREDVIRFAFALGEKIVHRLVRNDPTIVRDQLAASLALLSRPSALEILVHPDDRQLVEEALPELLATIGGCEHAAIREDSTITRGGCVLMTQGGRVDGTIQTQLDRVAEALVPGRLDEAAPDSSSSTSSPPSIQPSDESGAAESS